MERQENNNRDYYAIDLLHIIKSIWKRAWVVVLSAFIAATVAFSYSSFVIEPTYSSSILLYVNNSSFSLGDTSFSISSSQITAAQSLVKTYVEILDNRTTLEKIIDKSGVSYTYQQLSGMISAAPSNETEIMRVTVTTENPYEAAKIANCIAEVLPERISEIIDGASMEVVDSAVPNVKKVAPYVTKYTAIGMILGVIVSVVVLAIFATMDDTIHDEDYVLQTYDYPILAKVPNLLSTSTKKYGYYYQSRQKNKK